MQTVKVKRIVERPVKVAEDAGLGHSELELSRQVLSDVTLMVNGLDGE